MDYFEKKNVKYDFHLVEKAALKYFRSLRQERRQNDDPERAEELSSKKRLRTRRQRTYESRTKYLLPEEREFWKDVTQEIMSDEEDTPTGLKLKSLAPMRIERLNTLIKTLDARKVTADNEKGILPARKCRVVSESPIKRKKKSLVTLLEEEMKNYPIYLSSVRL